MSKVAKKASQKGTIGKILRYIRKYWFFVGLSLVLAALTVAFTLYIPILTGNAVDLIIGVDNVDFPAIFKILKQIGVVMILTAIAQWVMNTCNNYITYHVVQDIRQDAFAKLEILPLKYLDRQSYGDIVSRIIADVDTFADGLLMGFTQLFTGVIGIIALTATMVQATKMLGDNGKSVLAEYAVLFAKQRLEGQKVKSAYGSLIWCRDEKYYAQGEWRGKWATEGGGVMINQALHTLDLLQWFCGMPNSVTATVNNHSLKNKIEVEDTAFGNFKVSDTANFVISATNSAKHSFPIVLNFASERDVIQITMDNVIINGEFFVKKDGKSAIGKEVWGTGHVKLIADYYNKLSSGEKFPIDFYEASKVVKLILSMYASNGKEIPIL